MQIGDRIALYLQIGSIEGMAGGGLEIYAIGMIHKGMQTVEFKFAELEEPGIIGAAMLPAAYV